MTVHFSTKSLTVPPGFAVEDLDWCVLSWDIYKRSGPDAFFYHVIAAPGAVVSSRGYSKTDSLDNLLASSFTSSRSQTQGHSALSEAMSITQDTLQRGMGYEWGCKPFLLDIGTVRTEVSPMTLREVYGDYGPFATAGQMLVSPVQDFLIEAVFQERKAALARQTVETR